jgi:hypothetical protein
MSEFAFYKAWSRYKGVEVEYPKPARAEEIRRVLELASISDEVLELMDMEEILNSYPQLASFVKEE